METLDYSTLALIPLLPALGAILNGILGSKLPEKVVATIACSAMGGAFIASLMSVIKMISWAAPDGHGHYEYPVLHHVWWEWFSAGDLHVDFALMLDPLSAVMILIITGVGLLIHVYSAGYMHGDPSYGRYFAYLNFFVFSMLCLVLGDNLVVLFLGWEGVGVASYLLIGFWYEDDEKASAGKKAFITNRVGDFAVLLGLFLLWQLSASGTGIPTFNFLELQDWASHLSREQVFVAVDQEALYAQGLESYEGGFRMSSFGWLITATCILFFIGCTGKSAQIPLYVWLPDAMAGPTPVSALIHAATMVTAGVYLIARMSFLFALAPYALNVVAVIGGLTAFFAATIGVTQFDIKKVLAYSTVSQLGYMFLAVGSGSFFAGVFHLMTHAFFKALLFLGSGSVIHAMHHEQDIRKMGGLRKYMPITAYTFLIGCIAIAGIIPFSGFFSKDEILWFALSNEHAYVGLTKYAPFRFMLWGLGVATAIMTAFYMFRLYFLTFEGECRADEETKSHIHESPFNMTMPLVFLAVLSTIGGLVGVPKILGGPIKWYLLDMHGWLHQVIHHGEAMFFNGFGGYGMAYMGLVVALGGAAAGIFAAWRLYAQPSDVPGQVVDRLGPIYDAIYNKYYVDELYQATIGRGVRAIGLLCHKVVDEIFIDLILVNGVGYATKFLGSVLRQLQNGDIQRYVAYAFIGVGVILYLLV